jgi:hypothetical protein
MTLETTPLVPIRALSPAVQAEGPEGEIYANPRGEVLVVQAMPELAELVRLGNSWQVASTTGQAALTALPTTVAGLSLLNSEAVGSDLLYVIDSFGSWEAVVDATQTDVTAIFAMLNKRNSAAPTGGTGETGFRSLSGVPTFGGAGSAQRGATVVNDGWFPHSTEGAQMAAAAAGANWKVNEARVRGLYLVQPGSAFNVQAVKAAAAAALQQFFFIRFHVVKVKHGT